jgi:FtsH-binding integral membrane protein
MDMQEIYAGGPNGAQSGVSRVDFIRSTYTYLAGAMLAFVALSTALHMSGVGMKMLAAMKGGQAVWLVVLGAFMLVGWLASYLADRSESNQTQMIGLGIYVLAEALIFSPMFALASIVAPGAIGAAGFITLLLVGALTWTAFTSKTNFSFLGGMLRIGGFVALGTIVAAVIFGFKLGIWFSGIMVLFAGACVLYDTSKIIHEYPTDRPAGAALHLFASIALMLWYVLRILISLASDD